jgi:hypothetical protein
MRRLALLLCLLPLAAACGGGGSKSSSPSTTPATTGVEAPDPGKQAFATLLHAAIKTDRKAMWNALSTPSQKRLGPYQQFAESTAPLIARALQPFETKDLVPFISQNVSSKFGVVAVRSGAKALAFPVRSENGTWKIETPGPVTFRILGPAPGSNGSVQQVAVEVHSPGVVDDAIVWVDGKLIRPTLAPGHGTATVFANLDRPLSPGTHIAVVYAQQGDNASAEAWSFSASG